MAETKVTTVNTEEKEKNVEILERHWKQIANDP